MCYQSDHVVGRILCDSMLHQYHILNSFILSALSMETQIPIISINAEYRLITSITPSQLHIM